MVDIGNASFDLLVNGSIIGAAVKSYEEATSFGGVVWVWPILFLFTLTFLMIKSESPTMVGIYVVLGNVALGSRLAESSRLIFVMILILSLVIWFFSLFISSKTE